MSWGGRLNTYVSAIIHSSSPDSVMHSTQSSVRSKGSYMKKQVKGDSAPILLSSPTGSSSVQVYHEYQKVAFKMFPGNGHTAETGSQTKKDGLQQVSVPDLASTSPDQKHSMKDKSFHNNSTWIMDLSSQAYSGPEDNSTDPHETLTETSTLTFVDAHIMEESHSLHGVGTVCVKEFVLIDDDDDGDMSLREKTVTDLSVMDGKAADLVCGRLLSTSSYSLSEYKEETPVAEVLLSDEAQSPDTNRHCCFCTIL